MMTLTNTQLFFLVYSILYYSIGIFLKAPRVRKRIHLYKPLSQREHRFYDFVSDLSIILGGIGIIVILLTLL